MTRLFKKSLVSVLFIIFLFTYIRPGYVEAAVYTIDPSDDLSDALALLGPGDTLILEDGIYTEPLIVNNSGTVSSPITIKAENDGGAIIDGQGSLFNAVDIGGNYVILEGIAARDTTNHVIVIDGNNVTAKRVSAYNANPSGNNHVWTVGGDNVLVEDCVGAGSGRYLFLAYEADNVTWRRCFGYWLNNTTDSQPKSVFGIYGSSNVSIINSIGTHVIPPNNNGSEEWSAVFITKNSDVTQKSPINAVIKGNIFTNIWKYGIIGNSDVASNLTIENNLIYNVKDSPCVFSSTCNINTAGIFTFESPSGVIKNNTIASNEYGIWLSNSGHTITNNNIISNDWAHRGTNNTSHTYTNLWNNTTTSANTWTLNGTTTQVNPNYDTTTYGVGAYLFIPQDSPLKDAGNNDEDIGANILYQYDQNGNLTNNRLWPWPLESRIVTETTRELGFAISPTWETSSGLWKTLSGVYPTAPNNPSSLNKYRSNGSTLITNGEWIDDTSVVFKFNMSSSNPTDSLTTQIELRNTNTSFSNVSTHQGSPVNYSGSPVQGTVTITGLSTNTQYHAQARVTNSIGSSSWVSMGINPNFGIDTTAPTVPGQPTTTTPTSDTTPTWNWSASTDTGSGLASSGYLIQWSQSSTFSSGVNSASSSSNSYTHTNPLTEGTWYFRLRAKDNLEHLSSYSNVSTVVIDYDVVITPTPTNSPDITPTSNVEVTPTIDITGTPSITPTSGAKIDIFKIKLIDTNNRPLANALLTIRPESLNAITDIDGLATFNNVPIGRHTLDITYQNQTISKALFVENNNTSINEGITIVYENTITTSSGSQFPLSSNTNLVNIGIVITAIALSAIAFWYFKTKTKA